MNKRTLVIVANHIQESKANGRKDGAIADAHQRTRIFILDLCESGLLRGSFCRGSGSIGS